MIDIVSWFGIPPVDEAPDRASVVHVIDSTKLCKEEPSMQTDKFERVKRRPPEAHE